MTPKHQITEDSTIIVTADQVSCDLDGETVILQLSSGMYYGLEFVGSRIWELIQEPTTVREIRDILLDEYDVKPDRCEVDLTAFLKELFRRDLIEVKNGQGASIPPSASG